MAKKITAISIYNKTTGWSQFYPVGADATTIEQASDTTFGVVKIFSSTGNNTDGTMTQRAITAAIQNAIDSIPSAANASNTTAGVAKLYNTTGSNTDGAITQGAATDALNTKLEKVTANGVTISASSSLKGITLTAGSNISISANQSTGNITLSSTNTTYGVATTTSNGLMSSSQVSTLNSVKNFVDNYEDYGDWTVAKQVSVATSDWSSSTTTVSGVNYYTATKTMTTIYDPHPVVVCGASGVLPTVTERTAYDTLSYVTVDTSTKVVKFYAQSKPTSTVYVVVKGVE